MIGEPAAVARAVYSAGRSVRRLPAGSGGGGSRVGAAVRLVGRQPECGGLPALRTAVLERVLQAMANTGVPRIHFGVGTAELLELMGAAGAEVIGVDWRLSLAEASRRVGQRYARAGQPRSRAAVCARGRRLSERVREVIRSGAVAPGHIFNLGHGVPPDADPGVLAMIVELVHSEGARAAPSGS